MKFLNFFKAKEKAPQKRRSSDIVADAVHKSAVNGGYYLDFPTFLANNGYNDLSAYASMLLYQACMPLYNAIDRRATAFSGIPVRLWDKKEKEFISDHPVLELLNKPSPDSTQIDFLYQFASYFDITGNSFLLLYGDTNKPPTEMVTVKPSDVTFGFGSKFGFQRIPDSIRYTEAEAGSMHFKATTDIRRDAVRFINDSQDLEAWHVKQFNPFRSTSNFWGLSKAQPLWLEIQQFISGNKTNLSMLKRGTRLSMVWSYKPGVDGEPLSKAQLERLQEQAQKYMGDENAGATPVLDQMEVTPVQQSNRDMEFNDMQDTMEARINKVFDIPLAKITTSAMTLNNLETAQLQFYDDAVLPLATYLYAELNRVLLPRYPDTENLELRYNEHDIPALKVRIIANAKEQHSIGVNTPDETRAALGYEGLESGGDTILVPANLVPLGEDAYTEDELTEPTATKARRYLKKCKKDDGSPRYTDEEIDDMLIKSITKSYL